jgi:DNA-binding transcriptional LysR family regulator
VDAHGLPTTLDELPHHWLVNYQPNPASQPAAFEYVDAARGSSVYLPMRHKVTVNNSVAYNAATHAGLGIAQIPASRARVEIAAGLLVAVLPHHQAAPMAARILFPHRRNIPQRVRAFADWIVEITRAEAA